jgi:uncharacterized protein
MHEHGTQTETARPRAPGDALHSIPHPDVVTSVIQHYVKPGTEAQYEAWLREITPIAQRSPGHQGANVIRPPEGTGLYTIVLHFDTLEHAQTWLASDTRRALLAQVEPQLVHGDQVEIKTGLEFWFTPPSVQKHAKPYKQFLLTFSAIFPLTMLVPWVLQPLCQAVPVLGLPGIRRDAPLYWSAVLADHTRTAEAAPPRHWDESTLQNYLETYSGISSCGHAHLCGQRTQKFIRFHT